MKSNEIVVIVKNLPPQNEKFIISESSTIKMLKSLLITKNKKLKDIKDFIFVYNGKLIKNELLTFKDYNISNNSKLNFVKLNVKKN